MSRYIVAFAPHAEKEIERLPAKQAARIMEAIDRLANDPRPQGYKKLVGQDGLYRIRVGNYRVIYAIIDKKVTVLIARVRHRKDAYDQLSPS